MGVTRVTELDAEVILDNSPNLSKARVTELDVAVILRNSPDPGGQLVDYELAVDLNDDGDFTDANEVIDPVYIRRISIKGGGVDPITGAPILSELEVELDNSNGRFSPTNTSSPIYPNLQRGRKIRCRVTIQAVTYDRFIGKIDDIDVDPSRAGHSATIRAVDLLADLRDAPVAGRDWQGVNIKTIIENIAQDAGWTGTLDFDVTGDAPAFVQIPEGGDALSVPTDIARTELGRFYSKPDKTLRYEERHYRRRAEQSIYATIDREWLEGQFRFHDLIDPRATSSVRVTLQPLTPGPLQEVWKRQQGAIVVPKNSSKTTYSEFDHQVINLQTPTTANEDLAAQFTDGSGDASGSLTVTVTTKGRRVKIVFANAHATKDLRVSEFRLRGQPIISDERFTPQALTADAESKRVARRLRESFEAEDLTTSLGTIPTEISPFYSSSPTYGQALADETLSRALVKRVGVEFTTVATTLLRLEQLYGMRVSHRLRLQHTATHEFDKQVWVNRISEEFTPFRSPRITIEAIECEANQSVWRLGQAALNTSPTLVSF